MRTVLLIDDEPDMGPLVDLWVKDLGARVVQASNLSEALGAARASAPSVVLLDLSLDGEDGLALLPDLRREESLADVPVLAFSVHDSREAEARSKGVVGFVRKPFSSRELRDALKRYL